MEFPLRENKTPQAINEIKAPLLTKRTHTVGIHLKLMSLKFKKAANMADMDINKNGIIQTDKNN
jgi:hypothetical protein